MAAETSPGVTWGPTHAAGAEKPSNAAAARLLGDRSMANHKPPRETALIVGAGEGLSAALARLFVKAEMRVALAARETDKLAALCAETGALAYTCDASKGGDVDALFGAVARDLAAPDIVVFNASYRTR